LLFKVVTFVAQRLQVSFYIYLAIATDKQFLVDKETKA